MVQAAINRERAVAIAHLPSVGRWSLRVKARAPVAATGHDDVRSRLSRLQPTCEEVFLRVMDAESWSNLRDASNQLRFLSLHAQRLVEELSAERGTNPEIRAAVAALENVRGAIERTRRRPHGTQPSFTEVRTALYDGIWQLRYGLLVLHWTRTPTVGHAAPRTG